MLEEFFGFGRVVVGELFLSVERADAVSNNGNAGTVAKFFMYTRRKLVCETLLSRVWYGFPLSRE